MVVCRFLPFSAAIAIVLAVVAPDILGQEYESTAESAIRYQRFPWQHSGELTELSRDDPGRARSVERNAIPKRIRGNTNWPNFSLPGGWFTFFNSLIWVIIVALIAMVAAVLIYMYLRMNKSAAVGNKSEDYDQEEMIAERIKQLPFEFKRNQPGNLLEQARQLAGQGNYSRATMFLFSHVLLSLDKHELIRLKRGKTNRQYLNELRRHRGICDYYQRVMVPFEDAFFGNHTITQSRFEECWNELSRFQSNVDNATQVPTP